jgi:hypothetical protein
MKFNKLALCLVLLFAASTCFAQMYTVTDLSTLGGSSSQGKAINGLGQVAGTSNITGDRHLSYISHRSQQPYQSSQ